jgi:Tfp pilus assembly protein PilN
MAQQINLYSPIFLAPRRHFSAHAMVQALAVLAVALAALCAWAWWGSAALQRELRSTGARNADERQRLVTALAAQPASGAAADVLGQELARVQADLAQRRRMLAELDRGRVVEGRSHAAMLRLVAQTVPASAWLTDARLVEGRLELTGMTLQPEALRPWLARLAGHPLTAGQQLAAVKIERSTAPGSDAWGFSIVSSTPEAAR